MTGGHEGDGDTSCNWCTWNRPQMPGKKTGGTLIQTKNQNHSDHSIFKICETTEKSHGDLRRLAVT